MSDQLEQRILEVIQDVLRNTGENQDVQITADDSMETVAAWDSLTFMSVFVAINEAFDMTPDFDDAIHYTSVKTLYAFLKEQIA